MKRYFEWNTAWASSHWGFKPLLRVENGKLGLHPLKITDEDRFAKACLIWFFTWVVCEMIDNHIKETLTK